ncbi:MAG: Cys-Gln thioester bond-forming surface protein [Catenisphaera adipataccumulans]
MVNQGYKKLGEPFEGMTDAQSYAATQLAIWATLEPGVRQYANFWT